MNWISIVCIVWLISSFFSGFKMGFVYKVGNLIGLLLGLWVASRYTPTVATWFGGGVGASITAFFFLLSLTSKVFGCIAWGLDKAFSIVKILPFVTTVNRLLGAVLGVCISAFVLSSLIYVLQGLPLSDSLQKTVDESSVARGLGKLSVFYEPILSQKLNDYLHL